MESQGTLIWSMEGGSIGLMGLISQAVHDGGRHVIGYSQDAHALRGMDDDHYSEYVVSSISISNDYLMKILIMEGTQFIGVFLSGLLVKEGNQCVSPGEGTGATMSDDDDDQVDNQVDSDTNLFDGSLEGADILGFGPLVPTDSERSLMERVRQELKHELKQGYKEKIVDIREEILCKRRAESSLEEDKARLVQETGLQLKQINNWFINQRKRNWHSNFSTSTVLKSKRKR
ncbi:unnamed protein product [Camellia sinensis]